MHAYSHLNVGTGQDVTIGEFARLVADVVGFRGELVFDPSRPDGTPRKRLDVSRLQALGWTARTSLEEGLRRTYADFQAGGGRSRRIGGTAAPLTPARPLAPARLDAPAWPVAPAQPDATAGPAP